MSAEYTGMMFDAQSPALGGFTGTRGERHGYVHPGVWNLTRHKGKPTSGRFVYRSRSRNLWHWQCDLCHSYEIDFQSWADAMRNALDHANQCNNVCTKNRSYKLLTPIHIFIPGDK